MSTAEDLRQRGTGVCACVCVCCTLLRHSEGCCAVLWQGRAVLRCATRSSKQEATAQQPAPHTLDGRSTSRSGLQTWHCVASWARLMRESATSSAISPLSGWHSSSLSTSTPRRCRRGRGTAGRCQTAAHSWQVTASGTAVAGGGLPAHAGCPPRRAGAQAHLCEHRVKGVLRVDQRHSAALPLHLGHGMQCQRRLAARLCNGSRPTAGLDHAAAAQPCRWAGRAGARPQPSPHSPPHHRHACTITHVDAARPRCHSLCLPCLHVPRLHVSRRAGHPPGP